MEHIKRKKVKLPKGRPPLTYGDEINDIMFDLFNIESYLSEIADIEYRDMGNTQDASSPRAGGSGTFRGSE